MTDFADRLELVIELDGGGYYTAKLEKLAQADNRSKQDGHRPPITK